MADLSAERESPLRAEIPPDPGGGIYVAPPKLKGWLTALPAVGVVGVVGVVVAPAAATGAGVLKLKVLGELAPAASGLPPKVKGFPPLGDATDGEGEGAAAAAPNENTPFPAAPEAAVEGSDVWPKRNPVAAASPPLEDGTNLNVAPGCGG